MVLNLVRSRLQQGEKEYGYEFSEAAALAAWAREVTVMLDAQ